MLTFSFHFHAASCMLILTRSDQEYCVLILKHTLKYFVCQSHTLGVFILKDIYLNNSRFKIIMSLAQRINVFVGY